MAVTKNLTSGVGTRVLRCAKAVSKLTPKVNSSDISLNSSAMGSGISSPTFWMAALSD